MSKALKKLPPASVELGGLGPSAGRPVRPPGEAGVLRAVDDLRRDVRLIPDVERAVRVAIRKAAALFRADDHCCAVISPGVGEADLIFWTGRPESWDRRLLGTFAQGDRGGVPVDVALARLRRRSRPWAAAALRWDQGLVDWDVRNAFTHFAKGLNEIIAGIDGDRIVEVRSRIDRKIMEQLRSRDLFYQILDGLRSLTRFDHSATLLIGERDDPLLEIVAEKLAWRRGKSERVGQRVPIEPAEFDELFQRGVIGFRRAEGPFVPWAGGRCYAWVETLAAMACSAAGQEPRIAELIVAPLSTRDGLRAVLVVGAVHPGTLGEYESDLLSSFLPQVSIALHNSRRAEAMEAKMLETERKHAMADLARGVSHDVNNALGAIVPLLQQVREDLQTGQVDLETLKQDVEQIDRSVRICRGIFGSMLRFARTAARPGGDGCVHSAVDMCLAILGDNLRRHGIRVATSVPEDVAKVSVNQAELEQLLLNLITNARDAMRCGGTLEIGSRREGGMVVVEVKDDGCGIPPENLGRVQDAFFTTKPDGNGLGLSICRSIVWRCEGDLEIRSAPGQGTCVSMRLPVVATAPKTDPSGAGAA